MTGLDLLMHAENLRREIARREERIGTLRRLAEAIGCPLPGDLRIVSSRDPGRTQRLVDEAVDEAEAVRLLREERDAVLGELALLISLLPDPLSAGVLQLRYLEGLSWQEVLRRIHLSRSHAFEKHRRALDFLGSREVKQLQSAPESGYTFKS